MKKNIRSCLTTTKADFCQQLNERIALGKKILAEQVQTAEALMNYKEEISKWTDFNKELLKQSFDNPENEYRQEYIKGYFRRAFIGSHALHGEIEEKKRKITCYIRGLEKIADKIDLIPLGNKK